MLDLKDGVVCAFCSTRLPRACHLRAHLYKGVRSLLLGFPDDPSYASPWSGSAIHPLRFTDLVQEVAHEMAQGTAGHSNQDVEAVPLLMLPPSDVSDARHRAATPLRDESDGGCGQVRAAAIVAAVGALESS